MKNLSQTQHCRLDPRRKEKEKVENNGPLQECFSCEHCSSHKANVHLSCSYTLLPFYYNFLLLPILTLVIAFVLVCFVISLGSERT